MQDIACRTSNIMCSRAQEQHCFLLYCLLHRADGQGSLHLLQLWLLPQMQIQPLFRLAMEFQIRQWLQSELAQTLPRLHPSLCPPPQPLRHLRMVAKIRPLKHQELWPRVMRTWLSVSCAGRRLQQPCGHVCTCYGCIEVLADALCPMCRCEVVSIIVLQL